MRVSFFQRLSNKLPISVIRFLFNIWPPFRGAGIKVNHIAPDFCSFDVSMKLGMFNRNYAGVHFGGSLFAMKDPCYVIILTKNLGMDYIVWDKAAKIEFKKPGRGKVHANCSMTKEEINLVREETDRSGKYIFDRSIDLFNDSNEVIATITKTLYVRKLQPATQLTS